MRQPAAHTQPACVRRAAAARRLLAVGVRVAACGANQLAQTHRTGLPGRLGALSALSVDAPVGAPPDRERKRSHSSPLSDLSSLNPKTSLTEATLPTLDSTRHYTQLIGSLGLALYT